MDFRLRKDTTRVPKPVERHVGQEGSTTTELSPTTNKSQKRYINKK